MRSCLWSGHRQTADSVLNDHAGNYASNRAKADSMAPTVASVREHEERIRLSLQLDEGVV